ncbi:hypothetical protein [Demequina aurantiaca]|uniref:hypothetical protein n=1 Tax=Demequina aurantiaca TaxID=676200 RepID=UPI003D34F7FE
MTKLRNFKKGWALALALALTVTFAGPTYAVNAASEGDGQEAAQPVTTAKKDKPEVHKVAICHATSSKSNPYTSNKVSWSSIDNETEVDWNGHGNHDGDIIPAFGDFPGKNLGAIGDSTGQAILKNGCNVPEAPKTVVNPSNPVIVDMCGTEDDSYTRPADTDSIKYYSDGGYVYAEITADNTVWGDSHSGWKNANGKLKFKIEFTDEACQPEAPADLVETDSMIGDFECNSETVDVKTTTTTTPYKWSKHKESWVLDTKNSSTEVTYETRPLTEEELAQCPPKVVSEWVLWTLPEAGCVDASKLNMGFANASNSKGWKNCNTAGNTFPQTNPQVMTEAQLKSFVPACGTWYQADLYKGTQAAIDAVLADGMLTYKNGKVEDSKLVKKWFYLEGPDCTSEVMPAAPTVVEVCGVDNNDIITLPVTPGIEYSLTDDYVVAHIMDPEANVWGDMPEGWTVADNGNAMLMLADFHTDSNERCVVPTPPRPAFVDPCGLNNWVVTVPANTDEVTWGAVQDNIALNGKVGVTATATAGYVFDNGNTTKAYAWTDVDSLLCSAPVPPVIVDECGVEDDRAVLPETEGVVYSQKVAPSGDIRVTAVPAEGYVFTDGTGSAKNNNIKYYTVTVGAGADFDLDTRDCVTVSVPAPSAECAFMVEDYPLPANTEGVTYEAWIAPNGQLRIKVSVDHTMHILVNHSAKDDYVKWFSFDVNEDACPTAVTPVAPTVVDVCGTVNDSRTLPTTEGVAYIFNSHDDHDFLFASLTAENTVWSLTDGWMDLGENNAELQLAALTNESCGSTEVLGEPPVETPTDVTVVLGAPPLAEAPSAVAVVAVATFAG